MAVAVADEEWVKAAMYDDTMVVELLVRLHAAAAPSNPPASVALPFEWTVRQRRSNSQKNQLQAQRCSPTTPLSWSGGGATSISGGSGGAGFDEPCSRRRPQKPNSATRSKVNGDSEKSGSKRSRKKKTLAELQVEENSLEKENRELKREIADLCMNLEKQRATNENLKRMKVELQTPMNRDTSTAEKSTSYQHNQNPIPSTTNNNIPLQSSNTSKGCPKPDQGAKFTLPDLNVPFEENPCPMQYGTE